MRKQKDNKGESSGRGKGSTSSGPEHPNCAYFLYQTCTFIRFISVSSSLPATSYVKMVDIWMLFNLIIPFIEVYNWSDEVTFNLRKKNGKLSDF